MAKILTGIVVSTGMEKTIVVEVTRHVAHPMYKKLMKRSKKHKADNSAGIAVKVGQTVSIIETKPISKDKHFRLLNPEVSTSNVAAAKEEKVSKVSKGEEIKVEKETKKKGTKRV